MAELDKIMTALRNAHAAGDTESAKRLAAMAKAAKATPQAATQPAAQGGGQIVPAMPMPRNPELVTQGPGPTGMISPELYDKGILPRRYNEGMAKPESGPAMIRDERTGMEMPEYVTTGTGERAYYNPETSTYSTEGMYAEGMKPGAGKAFQAGAAQGFTLGWGDELASVLLGERTGAKSRAMLEAARRDRPMTALAGEVAGAVAAPVPVKGGATVKEAMKEGAKLGAKLGFVYGTGNAEGGAVERIKGGLEGAVSGALFGGAAPVAVNFGTKAFKRLFGISAERPSLESLRATKTAAYKAVEDAGETFGPDDLKGLAEAATSRMDDLNYLPEVDTTTAAMLKKLEVLSGKNLTIGQVDKFRRAVWERYNSTKEQGLLEIIDSIDEMIAGRTSTSELLDAARVANARYKKAELLDLAFQKAADQTAATGSGGNVLNKMRQAVTSIINNPKQAKWFTPQEIETMRGFVQGTVSENIMRRIGKLAPSGNGLMTALNLMGVAQFGPEALAVSALASGAKGLSDRSAEQGAQRLIGMVAGQSSPPAVATGIPATRFIRAAGPVGNALAPR